MKIFLRLFFIFSLLYIHRVLPVFEPKGINYLISILTLFIVYKEFLKLKNLLPIYVKGLHIKSFVYYLLILVILFFGVLQMTLIDTFGNQRYIRLFFIVVIIAVLSKMFVMLMKSQFNNLTKGLFSTLFMSISFLLLIESFFMFKTLSHGSGEAYSGKLWTKKYWNPINKYGYRDKEVVKNENTILFVGDSFTAGTGIDKIEDRFSEQTISFLNQRNIKYHSINIGKYGADTKQEYENTIDFLNKTKVHPKKIVLQYFYNDIENLMSKYQTKCLSSSSNPIKTSVLSKLATYSYVINYFYWLYPPVATTSENVPEECMYLNQLKYAYADTTITKELETYFTKFIELSKSQKAELIIVYYPFMEDLEMSSKLGIDKWIIHFFKKNKIKLLNVKKYISHLDSNKRRATPTDAHASVEVNKIVGRELSKYILK